MSAQAEEHALRTAGLVEQLVPDPTKPPDLIPIVGLVGKAKKRGAWRIYLNWALSEYYEIEEKHIRAVRPVDRDRSRVWVENVDKAIKYVDLTPRNDGTGKPISKKHLELAAKIAQEADWNGYARALPLPDGWSLLAP
jgi:hypothetical protein